MINLSGFCAADAAQCSFGATPPPINATVPPTPAQIAAAASSGPYRTVASSIAAGVGAALYRIGASVGKNLVCPFLPELGGALGAALGTATGIESIVLGPIAITIGELGAAVGAAAGEDVKRSLCS